MLGDAAKSTARGKTQLFCRNVSSMTFRSTESVLIRSRHLVPRSSIVSVFGSVLFLSCEGYNLGIFPHGAVDLIARDDDNGSGGGDNGGDDDDEYGGDNNNKDDDSVVVVDNE